LCYFEASAIANAQGISLNVKNASLENVFGQIKHQTGYTFWYRDNALEHAEKVSLNVKNASLKQTLELCFKGQQLTYEIVEKTIVVKEKIARSNDPPEKKQTDISGKVADTAGRPLSGATVKVKNSNLNTLTNDQGIFILKNVPDNAVLQILFMGYKTRELLVSSMDNDMVIRMEVDIASLQEVSVVSTGYQDIPKERATGSFVQINKELLDRRVGTNILDRLNGVTSGLIFNTGTKTSNDKLGINIRGRSTIDPNVNASPLIVLDNFPFEGDVSNINPNDIESITVLKDAAAAAIWGARSGNGVIVITTKKGRYNSALNIQFNSNLTIGAKPDLYYSRNYLNAGEYIELERTLFNQGYFDNDLTNTTSYPVLSPVVELLAKKRSNPTLSNEVEAELAALKNNDVRKDYEQYVYRNSIAQQHSLALRGGSSNTSYSVALGYDRNLPNVIRTSYDRFTINSLMGFRPYKNLELNIGLYYMTSTNVKVDEIGLGFYGNSVGNKWGALFPYARLANENGGHLNTPKTYRASYIQTAENNGMLNWRYNPLDEIDLSDNSTRINGLVLRTNLKYKLFDFLSTELQYQYENQNTRSRNYRSQDSYYTRDLINVFSQYNSTTKTYTYPFPSGGILEMSNGNLTANNLRWQFNYDQDLDKDHSVNAIAGAEIREVITGSLPQTLWGYNDEFGTSAINFNPTVSYPANPSGTRTLPVASANETETTNRYISYYTAGTYTYKDRYMLSASARKDGANIFGVKTNDKIVPLWSAGLGYEISKEPFYPFAFLPYAKLRATYGFNGNVYNASAYLTARYSNSNLTGLQYATVITPPNPELSWERVKNINIGLDLATRNNRISGTVELYKKYGLDLIQSTPLAPSTGYYNFQGNAASTLTKGIDVIINTKNLDGKLKWATNFLYSIQRDKVTSYDPANLGSSLAAIYTGVAQAAQSTLLLRPVTGKPLFAIYSYQWAGIDPANGDPQGYLNGNVSKDYLAIINNATADNLVFHGSSTPSTYGSIRNTFTYQNISLSANITYKLGYYYRKSSIALNYQGIGALSHSDYSSRWQKPGDEQASAVPSLVYVTNANRNTFYQNSEVLVEKGDHIRLQDLSLDYQIDRAIWRKMPFRSLQPYLYARNLGLLWRANKSGIDPDQIINRSYPDPFTIAFGLRVGLN
jgi:TonB-linked SusC/RagA family outer membrane protein